MGLDRSERICVVGAGAAGLSAAVHLRDAGFRNIVILERERVVGGKCLSFRREGQVWELGAVLGTLDYEATLDIMRRVGVEPWRREGPCADPDRSFVGQGFWPVRCVFPGWVGPLETLPGLWQIARYQLLAPRWKEVFAPTHAGVPEELAEPFSDWVRRHRMGELAKLYAIPFTSYGYGYYEDIPAAYVLKFFDPALTRCLVTPRRFFYWEEGVQAVWERTAAAFDVRTGVRIGAARRGEDGVEVSWTSDSGGATERFDRLVLTCPLDDALSFLDADEEERDLVSRIVHNDYRVRLVETAGLRVPAGFAPGRFRREGMGKPMIWDERVPGAGLSTYYVLGDGRISDAEVERNIEADVRLLGGEVRGLVASVNWKYFPHVSSADYRAGYYRRFEARQGLRRTYLAGEIAAFSSIERSVRYSRDLVRRFFA